MLVNCLNQRTHICHQRIYHLHLLCSCSHKQRKVDLLPGLQQRRRENRLGDTRVGGPRPGSYDERRRERQVEHGALVHDDDVIG